MKRVVAAVVVLGACAAVAQVAATAEVEQLYLDPAARGSLLAGNGQTLKGGTFRASVALQYTQGHVNSAGATLLRDRFAVHLLGAVGITHWLELSGDLPVVVHQASQSPAFAPAKSGLGTPFIHAKIAILGTESAVSLWAALGVGIPAGSPAALGSSGLAFAPRINAGRSFERIQLGAELGALIRGLGSFAEASGGSAAFVSRPDRVGSQLYLSAAATTLGAGLRGEASFRAYASLVGARPGVELLFGARYPVKDLELFFAGGPGIGGAPATPTYRLYAGVAFGNGGPPLPRCTESIAYPLAECPLLDKDGDGVPNGVDLKPLAPEDKDGFQDEDGAPDPDNDADGILDGDDACRDVKGTKENGGCPEVPPAEPAAVPEPTEP